jgi:hypothetical protein
MNTRLIEKFNELWVKYFGNEELPITFYYSDKIGDIEEVKASERWSCMIGQLAMVRKGTSLAFNIDSIGCAGGKKNSGYTKDLRPDFEYFLSCGNERIKGEKFLKTPELVMNFHSSAPWSPSKAKYLIFKRWDMLLEEDLPEVVIFFAKADVLSGLFTLSSFDRDYNDAVTAPFGAGCASIIQYPLEEAKLAKPKTVLGMFDISARPYVPENVLTAAIPYQRFVEMVENMEESFLTTNTWNVVKNRINK